MPKFLWSGKSVSGAKVVDEIEAENAIEARKILETRGWTQLRQHTSELQDFVRRQAQSGHPRRENHTPEEQLQFHQGTAPGFWQNWAKTISGATGTILLLTSVIVVTFYDRGKPDIITGLFVSLLLFVLLLYPVLWWWFRRTKRWFVKLQRARMWHRWEEVLRCLNKLSDLKQSTKIGIGDFSMARYRAVALAGLGRLDEALTCYCQAAAAAKASQSQFYLLQSGIYSTAKQYDKALECYRQAFEEATDKATACLSLGSYLVERFDHPEEARLLLGQVEQGQLSELEQMHVPFLRGVIAYREKDFAVMDANIREALAAFESRPRSKAYIFEASVLKCKGYLAVSSAALGRKVEARRYYAETKEYLALLDLPELLKEYEALAGSG